MNIKHLAATLGTAALLAAAPAFASAADFSAPISLNNVQITPSQNQQSGYDAGSVSVAFTNNKPVAATDVEFALQSNGKILDIFDAEGTFSTGTQIRKEFADNQLDENQQLTIVMVTYADGSTWTNDNVSYLPEAAPANVAGFSAYAPEY